MIQSVPETQSTNADLIQMAQAGAPEGRWLRADSQTGGRGRMGRLWQSPAGNLYASTLIRLRSGDPAPATLAFVAAVALIETVRVYAPEAGFQLKWPNDVMVGGAKLSGILLERNDDAVICGIGVNLAHHPDLPDRPAISLAALGAEIAPAVFCETLAEAFSRWLSRWRGEGLEPVRQSWLKAAHPKGTALSVRTGEGETLEGLFDGLDPHCALLLRLADGTIRAIHAGDVFLI